MRNADRARDAYAAWARHDLDAVVALAAEDIEFVQDPAFPGATSARGRAALREWLGSFFDIWEEFDLAPEEILELGERVLVIARVRARGKGSGMEIEQSAAHLLTFGDGEVTRLETFADPEAARAALWHPAELARLALERFNAGDLHGFLALVDPGVEFRSVILETEKEVFRGHAGVREYWNAVHDVLDGWRGEPVEVRDLGDGAVLVQLRVVGTGRGGGVHVEQIFWQAARAREGKVVWWAMFRTEEEALAAFR